MPLYLLSCYFTAKAVKSAGCDCVVLVCASSWGRDAAMTVKIDRDNPMQTIAKLICYHRRRSGLSRARLADIAGIGKTAVYDIEHGKESVRLSTLARVLASLNIDIALDSPLMQAYLEEDNASR